MAEEDLRNPFKQRKYCITDSYVDTFSEPNGLEFSYNVCYKGEVRARHQIVYVSLKSSKVLNIPLRHHKRLKTFGFLFLSSHAQFVKVIEEQLLPLVQITGYL